MARDYQGQRNWRGDNERSNRWRDENEGRYSSAGDEGNYDYRYTRDDEGDSSVRAGSYDQGRAQYGSREQGGQRGSSRYSGYGDFGQGEYGGRGREAREGFGGGNYGGADYGDRHPGSAGSRWSESWGRESGGRSNYGYGGDTGGSRQGGYGGNYGEGRYGEGGSRSRFETRGGYGGGRLAGTSGYGEADPGQGYANYGGSQGTSAWRGHGMEGDFSTGSLRGSETFGQGSQSGSRGHGSEYGGESGGRGMGQHRGKGPKGYARSDERLREMICERLHEDPHIDASDVTVTVQNARVTLEGTVDSRHTKNLVEDVAEQLGITDVQNNLRVQRQDQSGSQLTSQGAQSGTRGGATTDQSKSKQH